MLFLKTEGLNFKQHKSELRSKKVHNLIRYRAYGLWCFGPRPAKKLAKESSSVPEGPDLRFVGTGGTGGPVKFFLTV